MHHEKKNPTLYRERCEEGEKTRSVSFGSFEENWDSEIHEGFGEVNSVFTDVSDGEWCHGCARDRQRIIRYLTFPNKRRHSIRVCSSVGPSVFRNAFFKTNDTDFFLDFKLTIVAAYPNPLLFWWVLRPSRTRCPFLCFERRTFRLLPSWFRKWNWRFAQFPTTSPRNNLHTCRFLNRDVVHNEWIKILWMKISWEWHPFSKLIFESYRGQKLSFMKKIQEEILSLTMVYFFFYFDKKKFTQRNRHNKRT